MTRKNILKTFIITFILIMFCGIKNIYAAEGTLRMQVNNGTPWININVSQSYEACENLNKSTSTLGTTLLQAHLTTDEDWSAMAIFSVSQYVGATVNSPSTTNGNASGIYNVGRMMTQTTGLANTATANSNMYIFGLFNEDGSTKKYVRKDWNLADRESNSYVGFKVNNGTWAWMGGRNYWGTDTKYPVSVKLGLFGVAIGGYFSSYGSVASGEPNGSTTFRPVIWN